MATLKSMKIDEKDREGQKVATDQAPESPAYPWGLQVRLDDATLDKLGVDKLPKVGGELMLIAKVKVVSVSQSATESYKNKSVELQITHMCLEAVPADKDDATVLYEAKG